MTDRAGSTEIIMRAHVTERMLEPTGEAELQLVVKESGGNVTTLDLEKITQGGKFEVRRIDE